jgi:pimeloyl-ACP methyl ester carboxylesterase
VDNQKIDPEKPDTISGTKIWGYDGTGNVKSFVYQVTWVFTRCPQKLLITELKFEHPDYPNYEDWREIVEQTGTIDGNRVKVKARVLNMSGETKFADLKIVETYKGDQYNNLRPDEMLPEAQSSVRLEAGEEREVEFVWDTEGQAWYDDGRPHSTHRIKAELSENNQKKDEKIKNLKISPKPLVLVHGLWSSWKAWDTWQNLLTTAHSYDWKAYAVGEKPENGVMNTGGEFLSANKTNSIYENADELEKYIRFAQEDRNAWHVDLVAHSMGGLVYRDCIFTKQMPIMPDNRPQVKHLVMLGTPNAGSACADAIDLKFRAYGERVQAVKDLKPENVAILNQYVKDRKGVKFSALAGHSVPVMCGGYIWNDGVVSVESAINGVEDHAFSNDIHTELTNMRNFGNFVLPHLVTGPKRTYPVKVKSDKKSD